MTCAICRRHGGLVIRVLCARITTLLLKEAEVGAFTGFIKERDLANELGLTVWALRAWRKRNYGPAFGKVGRAVVYRRTDVEEFLASRLDGAGG